jgi:cyclic beta-1,2-glucan synthetase
VAIAQGKLPQEHWFRLGRSLTSSGGKPALLSWSGSMFEYLMPLLVMPTYRGTILDETYRGVVERQIEYGRERGVPWGVSESGYNKTDAQLNYQYRAFGVPGLGFKRGLADDLVIAPYASAMALMVAPRPRPANLRRLAREGRLGPHGFYEAIDYTPARLPRGRRASRWPRTWRTTRAWRSWRSTISCSTGRCSAASTPTRRFARPTCCCRSGCPAGGGVYPHPAEVSAAADAGGDSEHNVRVFTTPSTPSPQVQLLSNGRYHVMVTNAGGGYSRWRDLAVTRWHEDPTRDGWGSFCYLRDVGTGSFWSVAHQPTLATATRYEAIFSQGRAEFRRRRRHDRDPRRDQRVARGRRRAAPREPHQPRRRPADDRADQLRGGRAGHAGRRRGPPGVLQPVRADRAGPPAQAILCARRPRSGSEAPPSMFHLMTVQGRLAARRRTRRGAPSSSAAAARRSTRRRCTSRRWATARARCSTRWWRSATPW